MNYAARFPDFELSYETIAHKNVPSNYNIALFIPNGRKSFVWHTFNGDEDVMLLLDLDRDKRIVKTTQIGTTTTSLALGTIVYGVVVPDTQVFLIEDIYFYKGFPMKALNTGERLYYIREYLEAGATYGFPLLDRGAVICAGGARPPSLTENSGGAGAPLQMKLPVCRGVSPSTHLTQDQLLLDTSTIPYLAHHIQYRSLHQTVPYLNHTIDRKPVVADRPTPKSSVIYTPISNPDFSKPQYKCPTTFNVVADIQTDIYRIFAFAGQGMVYYNSAYIPNYKTSVLMNQLFRNIRENHCIDNIEESEDEAEFEDVREDKYVDLTKTLKMECVFHPKFKRWIPMKVADKSQRVIHIRMLTR